MIRYLAPLTVWLLAVVAAPPPLAQSPGGSTGGVGGTGGPGGEPFSWCSYHDQLQSSGEVCSGPYQVCDFGPPKVDCCSHLHLAMKWNECAQTGERRRGVVLKKYYDVVYGQCALTYCVEGASMKCPEHWVDECKTQDCF